MNRKKIIDTLLWTVIIFGIFIIPTALFKLSFAKFLLSNVPYVVISGVISLILAFILGKNKKLGGWLIFSGLSFISFIVIGVKFIDDQHAEKVEWKASDDRFTIDFVVGNQGYIYLKASVNDTSGLFLFDTGTSMSIVNEKFVADKKMKLHPYTITDSKGIQQTKNLFKVNSFKLGEIEIKRLPVYPEDSLAWTVPKGNNYKQDSVFGIIGNNIISKFIWDFDLINKRVTVSKSKRYCKDLPDSLSVPLFSNKDNKDIRVKINGAEKMLTFDFGAATPLCLYGTIPNRLPDNKKSYSQSSSIGVLNHLDSTIRKDSNFDFADVELGAFKFSEIKCVENEHFDLLGIPFIWAYERVVVDYMNDQAFFITENDHSGKLGVKSFNRENIWSSAREIKLKGKPEGREVIFSNDSTKIRHVFYGSLTVFQNDSQLDSIAYQDSVLMPNGRIKHGPSTVKFKD